MGLGKTIQTIAFLALLQDTQRLEGPVLILAPKVWSPKHSTAHQGTAYPCMGEPCTASELGPAAELCRCDGCRE